MDDRKGFTLVELLAVIVVIGLVLGLTIYGITNIFGNTKDKTVKLDKAGILKSAKLYSEEQPDSSWLEDDNNKYYCVTIEELKNKGFINKNAKLESLDKTDYVKFTKNKTALVSDNGVFVKKDQIDICTGNEVKRENADSYPSIDKSKSYTDTLVINYSNGTIKKDGVEVSIAETKYYYGNTSGNLKEIKYTEEELEKNKTSQTFIIDHLKNNSFYYVRVCQKTQNSKQICTDTTSIKTVDFTDTQINMEGKTSIITYKNDDKIYKEAGYYFMSTISGEVESDVIPCTLNNDKFDCGESTTKTIESNKWYKTETNPILINYTTLGKITIKTRITDPSNNYKENNKDLTLYGIATIKFNPNGGSVQESSTYTDGNIYKWSTNDNGYITRTAANGSTYKLFTKKYTHNGEPDDLPNYNYEPYLNITKTGYSAPEGNEWKCTSDDCLGKTFGQSYDYKYTSSNFCDTTKKNCEIVLEVNWKPNTYTINYYGNGSTSQTYNSSTSCNSDNECGLDRYSTGTTYDSTNKIFKHATKRTYDVSFNLATNLYKKTGYTFIGWNTASDGSGTSYSDKENVSNLGTTNGQVVKLYAQWSPNTIKITFNKNGGTGGTNIMYYKFNTKKFYSNSGCTTEITSVTAPTKSGYSFKGYQGDGTSGGSKGEFFPNNLSNTDIYRKIYKDATLTAKWEDDIAPTITMSLTSSKTYCSGTSITLNCSDEGSGMKEAKMVDAGYTTTGTTSTTQNFITTRSGSTATTVTCTDKNNNSSTATYYYTIVSCSSGGGSSSGCNTSYITCLGTASSQTACINNGGYHYSYGDCYKKVCGTSCPSGWIKT